MSRPPKMIQKEGEARIDYLLRVLRMFMGATIAGEQSIVYDDAECDGCCLADDIAAEISALDFSRGEA